MKTLKMIKWCISSVAMAMLLGGCAAPKKHEREAMVKADAEGLTVIESANFDGTFVAPNVNFSQYRRLLVEQLDLNEVVIRKPTALSPSQDTPWELNDSDKRYYQERYTEALMNNLMQDGAYATAVEVGQDVIRLQAKVVEIAPLASKDDAKGRPTRTQVYSEGMGTMTLELSMYDSVSGKVLAIITDKRDLGKVWEVNNRATNNIQVRVAFNAWLKKLRSELDRLRLQSSMSTR